MNLKHLFSILSVTSFYFLLEGPVFWILVLIFQRHTHCLRPFQHQLRSSRPKYVNRAFMIQAIVNPLDKGMMGAIVTAQALAGNDSFFMNYLKAFRADLVDG